MRWKIFLLILSLLVGSSVMGTELEEIRKAIREKGAKWTAGETSVSKLSPEERKRLLGDNLADEFPETPGAGLEVPKVTPPEFDWRNKDGHFWMTPIKDQENCGACVAFGAVGALEANLKIRANNFWIMPDLSEQHIFSCGRGPGGCESGWSLSSAMGYLLAYGAPDEACLPYTAVDDNCDETCLDWQVRARKISSWGWTSKLISDIKQAIYDYGPLEGHFYVYTDFFSYNGGVYEYVWGEKEGGHAITVLGWSDSSLCWICKNSWGPNWGEYGPYPDSTRGWFRLKYGDLYCQLEERRAVWLIPVSKGPDGMVLNKESFEFVLPSDSSDSDALQILNVGDSTFVFNIDFHQPWLFVSPQSDTLDYNELSLLDISVSSSGLLGGVYAGTLSVSANAPGETPLYYVDVPVTLDVNPPFIRGDYNADGYVQMNDALSFLLNLFHQPGGYPSPCEDAADYNDDGALMMGDALTELLFLFSQPGGDSPAPPYPECGQDPTEDNLSCGSYPPCSGGKELMTVIPRYGGRGKDLANNGVFLGQPERKNKEDLLDISVFLCNSQSLSGFDITFKYGPQKAEVISVSREGLISGEFDFFAHCVDEEMGKIRIGSIPDLGMHNFLVSGKHKIADITLKMKGETAFDGASPISLDTAHFYDVYAQELPIGGINEIKLRESLASFFENLTNYPNPFNSITEIRYILPRESYVRLEVFNVMGQKVATLVNENQMAGYKKVCWDASSVTSGIYFYKITAWGITSIRKMVLLK